MWAEERKTEIDIRFISSIRDRVNDGCIYESFLFLQTGHCIKSTVGTVEIKRNIPVENKVIIRCYIASSCILVPTVENLVISVLFPSQ